MSVDREPMDIRPLETKSKRDPTMNEDYRVDIEIFLKLSLIVEVYSYEIERNLSVDWVISMNIEKCIAKRRNSLANLRK